MFFLIKLKSALTQKVQMSSSWKEYQVMKYYPLRKHMSLQSLPSDTSPDSSLKRHEWCSVISAAHPGYVPAWNNPPGTRRQKPDLSPLRPLEAQRRSSWYVWVHISACLVCFVLFSWKPFTLIAVTWSEFCPLKGCRKYTDVDEEREK